MLMPSVKEIEEKPSKGDYISYTIMLYRIALNPLWYFIVIIGLPAIFLLLIGSYYSVNPVWFLPGVILFIFSFLKPHTALCVFFIFLPVFGNRPSQTQTHYLILLSAFLLLGIYADLLKNKPVLLRFAARLRTNNIVISLIFLYFFVSMLSIAGFPVIYTAKRTIDYHLFLFKELLKVGEVNPLTSLTSVLYSIEAMLIGLYIFGAVKKGEMMAKFKSYLFAVIAGFLFSIIAGLLDYFGIISLTPFRIPESNRLTSFFTNSGWYSQYLSITFPLISVLLLSGLTYKTNFFLMIILMILGEITLLFSMQRGAWITYPFILILLWITIYVSKDKYEGKQIPGWELIKKHWLKVIISVPITIGISLMLVYTLRDYVATSKVNLQDTATEIVKRAENITKSDERRRLIKPALRLWMLNPIYGGGGDSFGWQYLKEFVEPKGIFNDIKLGDGTSFGTAHNLYLQTLSGRGFFGLVFIVAFLLYLLVKLINKGFGEAKGATSNDIAQAVISISLASSLIAILTYANVQEIFYSQPVQIIFWVVVFMGAALIHKSHIKYAKRQKLIYSIGNTVIILLLLLPVHVLNIREVQDIFNRFLSKYMIHLHINFRYAIYGYLVFAVFIFLFLSYKFIAANNVKRRIFKRYYGTDDSALH